MKFRSRFEERVKRTLDNTKINQTITYEKESISYVLVKKYIPDFCITRSDGTKIFIEAKGRFDREARQKMLAVKEQNPDLEIVLLFMKDQPLTKVSKMTYSEWCKKNKFDYSVGTIPLRWLQGTSNKKSSKNKEFPIVE